MSEKFSFLLNPPQVCVYILVYFPAQWQKSFLPVDSSVHDERVEKVATWDFFSVSADSCMQQNAECSLFKSTNLRR